MKDDLLLEVMNLSLVTGAGWVRELNAVFFRGDLCLLVSDEPRKISALFRILKGLDVPVEGNVICHGEGIGLVLADDELPAWSNPDQELSLYSTLSGIRRRTLNERMTAWDIEGIGKYPIRHLNAYEKKALFLAMETASDPDLLLCEEPLTGLTPGQTARMLRHLTGFGENRVVLIGTVNPDLFPEEIPRIHLDRRRIRSWEDSYTLWLKDHSSGKILADPPVRTPSFDSPVRSALAASVSAGADPLAADLTMPGSDDAQPAGAVDKEQVTIHVDLPVDPKTEYELRRIREIRFFEASPEGNGYDLDLLKADQDRLAELLAARGLFLPGKEDVR